MKKLEPEFFSAKLAMVDGGRAIRIDWRTVASMVRVVVSVSYGDGYCHHIEVFAGPSEVGNANYVLPTEVSLVAGVTAVFFDALGRAKGRAIQSFHPGARLAVAA